MNNVGINQNLKNAYYILKEILITTLISKKIIISNFL
jgi:hypothetical protein